MARKLERTVYMAIALFTMGMVSIHAARYGPTDVVKMGWLLSMTAGILAVWFDDTTNGEIMEDTKTLPTEVTAPQQRMIDTVTTLDGRVIGKPKQRKSGLEGVPWRGKFRPGETVELPGTDDQGSKVVVVCKVGAVSKNRVRLTKLSAHHVRKVEIPIESAKQDMG